MRYYREQMRVLLIRRAGDWLRHGKWPRSVSLLIMLCSIAMAASSGYQWAAWGIRDKWLLFPLCVVIGYLAFIGFLYLWMLPFSPMPSKALLVGANHPIATEIPMQSEFDETLARQMERQMIEVSDESEGVIGILVTAALLGVVFVLAHFVYYAPWYLGALLVDGGKIQHRAIVEPSLWGRMTTPLRQSWLAAIVVVGHYTLLGFALHVYLDLS